MRHDLSVASNAVRTGRDPLSARARRGFFGYTVPAPMQISDTVTICREELDSPVALALIEALNAQLCARYPEPEAGHFDPESHESFAGASVDHRPAGCAAGRCIGGALLAQLEAIALCRRAALVPIDRFGCDADSPPGLCLGKPL